MISILDKSLCCGCGACEQICKRNSIQMVVDTEGFLYPEVNTDKCVTCGACDKVCPIKSSAIIPEKESKPKAYGGYHKDEAIRYNSSSGGAFTLFAEYIIRLNGVVIGCGLDDNIKAIHMIVETIDELDKLRGSKYVQSYIGHSYADVKQFLENGRYVLFVGTPCQTAGLYTFLGAKHYERLFVVDFICHGVPSPRIFNDFIKSEQKKYASRIVSHRFRNKDRGWNQTGLQLGSYSVFENGINVRRYPAVADPYMNGFLDDIYLRPSCYDCKFKCISKEYADLTIADFWGVNKVDSELNDKKGTSLILINTLQGDRLWNQVTENFYFKEVDFECATEKNSPLTKSAKLRENRKQFFDDYYANGYKYVEKKYMSAFIWVYHKVVSMIMK